jgi:hypothetical protein
MPSIKDIIAGQSVGVGKRVIKAGADKLRGIINDRGLGNLPSFGPFSTVNLTYPLDVAEDPRQGHYVIFTVREISKPAEVQTHVDPISGKNVITRKETNKEEITEIEDSVIKGTYKEVYENINGKRTGNKINVRYANIDASRDSKNRFLLRAPTKRTSTLLTLYMPPQVKNITGAEYESVEMSPLTTISSAAITSFFRDNVNTDATSGALGKYIQKLLTTSLETVGFGGASEMLQLGSGIALADRMEFVFRNPKKRAFPYQFDFYPKSEREAQEVHEIIKTFRKHMLPSMASKESKTANPIFRVPHEFNIEYYYKGNENSFLNKIGNCYLTDCDVTYGGDRYTSFPTSQTKKGESGASPTEIHLNLNFQEMDVITQEDVEEGF